jgi:hypothetical protein
MKPLVGLLLVVSGTILAIPPVYEVLSYLEYENWPIVQVVLGVTCILIGLIFLMSQRKKADKKVIEIG